MRRLALIMLLLSADATAQGKFTRWLKNSRKVGTKSAVAALTSDNCSGATQMMGGTSVTWTRTTTATCTNNSGTLVQVASGQPRCNSSGCYIEKSSTNVIKNSADYSQSSWTIHTLTSTNGDSTCGTPPDGSGNAFREVATTNDSYVNQGSISVTSGLAYSLSFYSRKASDNAGSPAANAFLQITANNIVAMSLTSSWVYNSVSANANATSSSAQIYLGGGSTLQPGDGAVCFWSAQVEQQSAPTSYIPTGATSVTRNADNASVAKPGWMGNDVGCMSATILVSSVTAGARILSFGAAGEVYAVSATSIAVNDGTNTVTATVSSINGRSVVVRAFWKNSTLSLVADGVSASGSYDGSITANTLYLGSTSGSSNFLNGYISNVKLGNTSTGCI